MTEKTDNPDFDLSEEVKINLVKKAIMTHEGWMTLARTIGNDPVKRETVIKWLTYIGDNRGVNFTMMTHTQGVNNLSQLLVDQLDHYLNQVGE